MSDIRPIINDLWQRARAKGQASVTLDDAMTIVAERNGRNRVAFGRVNAWPSNLEVDLYAAQIGIPETATRTADQRGRYQIVEYTWPATTVEQPTLDLDLGPIVHPADDDAGLSHDERFQRFDAANPQVYRSLVSLALALVRAGRTHMGIGMLFEKLRYEYALTTADPEGWKLNNNLRSRYARKMMAEYPELAGVFETRTLRSC